jgi:hypothetical protein
MTFKPGHERIGGRQKGTPNKATLERQQALQQALEAGQSLLPPDIATLTPLAVLLLAMRHSWHAKAYGMAVKIAEIAAPYCHPRLASADLRVVESLASKSDDEIEAELRELRAKAAVDAEVVH